MAEGASPETGKSQARDLKIYLPAGLALSAVAIAFAAPPVPLAPAYHLFAEQRNLLGLPHFGDVLSNLAFLVVGLAGLAGLKEARARWFQAPTGEVWLYRVYFAGVALSAVGSTYYHLAPDNGSLFWDRLPITLVFMTLFAIFIADRADARFGVRWAFPGLVLLGVVALVHWRWSLDGEGGDQRFYLLVQVVPILVIPVLCWLFAGRATDGRYVACMFALYGLAKLAEYLDRWMMDLLGGLMSGHTIKHLLAAGAAYVVVFMLRRKGAA